MHEKIAQFILLKIPPHLVILLGKIHALSIQVLRIVILIGLAKTSTNETLVFIWVQYYEYTNSEDPVRGIYRKFPKYSDTQKFCCNHSKI